MTGKRVVFTGGTGKAGRHVLPHLKSKGYDLLNVDLKPFDHPGISTLIADLTHSGQAFNALTTHFGFDRFEAGRPPAAPDAVVHFAAIPRVLIEPDNETFRVNTISTYNVIEAAAKQAGSIMGAMRPSAQKRQESNAQAKKPEWQPQGPPGRGYQPPEPPAERSVTVIVTGLPSGILAESLSEEVKKSADGPLEWAQFSSSGNQFSLKDLASQNYTFINGLPAEAHSLQHGDEVRLGRSTFLFLVQEDPVVSVADSVLFSDGEASVVSEEIARLVPTANGPVAVGSDGVVHGVELPTGDLTALSEPVGDVLDVTRAGCAFDLLKKYDLHDDLLLTVKWAVRLDDTGFSTARRKRCWFHVHGTHWPLFTVKCRNS
jgi:hypothetical protein